LKLILKILLFAISINPLLGQNDIPIGTWRSHFNYNRTHLVEIVDERVYCAAQSGLFYYDTSDNSLNKLSKIQGLSDTRVTAMAYDNDLEIFALGYDNGNIDILVNDEILNVTKVKNSDIIESKTINAITIRNGLIYVSTNFGVIVIDHESGEVLEAYQNLGVQGESIKINGVVFKDDLIYLATNFGVLIGVISPNINLQDFNNWQRFEEALVSDQKIVSINSIDDEIIASDGTSLFSYNGANWVDIGYDGSGGEVLKLRKQQHEVIIISESAVHKLLSGGTIVKIELENLAIPKDAISTSTGVLWYADFSQGLSRFENGEIEHFAPNGIFEGVVGKIQLVGGKIVALPKSKSSLYQPINNGLGYAEFSEGSWRVISSDELLGIDNISSVSNDGKLIGSFGDGMLNTEEGIIYDNTNSTLTKGGALFEDVLVAGLSQDQNGNTWVASSGNRPLHKRDIDGNWESYFFGISASSRPVEIKVNNLNQVWMQLSNTTAGGVLVFDPATNKSRYLTSSNGKLPSTKVTDFEFTKDDEVWIGTENGLAFFPFFFGLVEDVSIEASRPIFNNQFLFEFEAISAIEIDAGNRKWVGTKDGLWLFEDNADELILNLNIDNSPIPSNNIIDLKIDPKTGELFVSTDKGLVSFRSDATSGELFHQEVKIFPNPVLPGYTGLVGMSGLVNDATIKITNVSGRLVKELRASGGSTSWNVADYNGVRAESGVYLVFSSSSDGKETFVGKIAVIN
jgi:ligand-binding sensor domain-containing protein